MSSPSNFKFTSWKLLGDTHGKKLTPVPEDRALDVGTFYPIMQSEPFWTTPTGQKLQKTSQEDFESRDWELAISPNYTINNCTETTMNPISTLGWSESESLDQIECALKRLRNYPLMMDPVDGNYTHVHASSDLDEMTDSVDCSDNMNNISLMEQLRLL